MHAADVFDNTKVSEHKCERRVELGACFERASQSKKRLPKTVAVLKARKDFLKDFSEFAYPLLKARFIRVVER
jgi:hypothetical protein